MFRYIVLCSVVDKEEWIRLDEDSKGFLLESEMSDIVKSELSEYLTPCTIQYDGVDDIETREVLYREDLVARVKLCPSKFRVYNSSYKGGISIITNQEHLELFLQSVDFVGTIVDNITLEENMFVIVC